MDLPMPARAPAHSPRRPVAVGVIRRRSGRTTTITVTPAGAAGRITPQRVTR